jgi:hypothetical protein
MVIGGAIHHRLKVLTGVGVSNDIERGISHAAPLAGYLYKFKVEL